jgi:hypothetical protein
MVNSWDFQRHTKTGKLKEGKPPSQIGWLTSIKAITSIWAEVKCKGLKHLKPRYLNQDALENLFGQIRGGCGSGDNPKFSICWEFKNSNFKWSDKLIFIWHKL